MRNLMLLVFIVASGLSLGCHDGPLYALKSVNPYYRSEWAKDTALGPTDWQREAELESLVINMPNMSASDQTYWHGQIKQILENDKNPQMRMTAVRALRSCKAEGTYDTLDSALTDESPKVRMAICAVLGSRDDAQSTNLLAKTIGSEANIDVKMAAIRGIGKHKSKQASIALKDSLNSRNPAVRVASVESLQSSTGQQLGDDPEVWVAFLDGVQVEAKDEMIR